jgi:hypothetical protein
MNEEIDEMLNGVKHWGGGEKLFRVNGLSIWVKSIMTIGVFLAVVVAMAINSIQIASLIWQVYHRKRILIKGLDGLHLGLRHVLRLRTHWGLRHVLRFCSPRQILICLNIDRRFLESFL